MTQILPYLPLLFDGLLMTVVVTVLGTTLALIIAFVLGLARVSQTRWLRAPATLLVEVFRGTSLLVLMFWFFFALPFLGIQLMPMTAAVLALGLNGGAYAAEIVRSSIAGRPEGQSEACVALGLSRRDTLWRILIPQSIPAMLPAFGNVLVDLLKATSLVSLVTITDLTFRAQMIRAATGETVAIFITILVMYFILSLLAGWLIRWLESRFDLRRGLPRRRLITAVTAKRKEVLV